MNKYDAIFESLQEKVNSGEITIEEAEAVNTAAYEKYVVAEESKAEDVADLLEELSDKVKDGDITIPKDIVDSLKDLCGDSCEKKDDDDDESDDSDSENDDTEEKCCK